MITFLEYYKLMEAGTTYEDRRRAELNSTALQNPPPAPAPTGPIDPTAQRWGNQISNNKQIMNPSAPQGAPARGAAEQPVAAPAAPVGPPVGTGDPQSPGDRYLGELQDLMSSGLQGEELKAAWNELYNRINADAEAVSASNDDINAAAAENPMDAVGVPDIDRYRGLANARNQTIKTGEKQGLVDSKQIRQLEDGSLILIV